MSQDLRKLLKKERERKFRMKEGHEDRFMERLDVSMPRQHKSFLPYWGIAASIVVLLGLGIYFFSINENSDLPVKTTVVSKEDTQEKNEGISLGDLSPDLKKIENYYVASINLELSQLEVSADNKALVDGFMERLGELNVEYNDLNKELNNMGPNDQTISALIQNLQLRLELLHKLKDKLNEFKSSKNEQVESNTI
ncbi:MAG: hypothetical protein ACR2MM_00760 [Flavobacteriaceae bacterium]